MPLVGLCPHSRPALVLLSYLPGRCCCCCCCGRRRRRRFLRAGCTDLRALWPRSFRRRSSSAGQVRHQGARRQIGSRHNSGGASEQTDSLLFAGMQGLTQRRPRKLAREKQHNTRKKGGGKRRRGEALKLNSQILQLTCGKERNSFSPSRCEKSRDDLLVVVLATLVCLLYLAHDCQV